MYGLVEHLWHANARGAGQRMCAGMSAVRAAALITFDSGWMVCSASVLFPSCHRRSSNHNLLQHPPPTSQWVLGQTQAGLPQLLLRLLRHLCLLLCACPPSCLQQVETMVFICCQSCRPAATAEYRRMPAGAVSFIQGEGAQVGEHHASVNSHSVLRLCCGTSGALTLALSIVRCRAVERLQQLLLSQENLAVTLPTACCLRDRQLRCR
jgi:hypothetical protein